MHFPNPLPSQPSTSTHPTDLDSTWKARIMPRQFTKETTPTNLGDTNIENRHLDPLANLHRRDNSNYSGNFSFLDIYCAESPNKTTNENLQIDEQDPLFVGEEEKEEGKGKGEGEGEGQGEDVRVGSNFVKSLDDSCALSNQKENYIDNDNMDKNNSPKNYGRFSQNYNLLGSTFYVKPTSNYLDIKILRSKFDRYGFKKSSSQSSTTIEEYNTWFKEYLEDASRKKKKWELFLASNGLSVSTKNSRDPASPESSFSENIPTRFPPRSEKVKKLIRRGIPPEWRGNAWFFYAGGHEKLNKHPGLYDRIVNETKNVKNKDTEVIERDLFRTFPDNLHFNSTLSEDLSRPQSEDLKSKKETHMIQCLRRVLVAFAQYQPQIGYCQSLNFLAGLLLLFMSEERSFWMLVILTERIIPKVHAANLEGVHTDQGVLMLCIKEYMPDLWKILGTNFEGETLREDQILIRLPPVTLVTSSWFMSLFVGNLPIETTLRVWDILWYEGSKTIFRISLTICKLCVESPDFQSHKVQNGGESDQIELFQLMQSYPKQLLDPNLVIDHCFKKIGGYGFGSLSQDEIDKCRRFVSKQREKMHLNDRRRDLTDISLQERQDLINSSHSSLSEDGIHDVYGFHRPIMSGMVWNRSISNKVKKRFVSKKKQN